MASSPLARPPEELCAEIHILPLAVMTLTERTLMGAADRANH